MNARGATQSEGRRAGQQQKSFRLLNILPPPNDALDAIKIVSFHMFPLPLTPTTNLSESVMEMF